MRDDHTVSVIQHSDRLMIGERGVCKHIDQGGVQMNRHQVFSMMLHDRSADLPQFILSPPYTIILLVLGNRPTAKL